MDDVLLTPPSASTTLPPPSIDELPPPDENDLPPPPGEDELPLPPPPAGDELPLPPPPGEDDLPPPEEMIESDDGAGPSAGGGGGGGGGEGEEWDADAYDMKRYTFGSGALLGPAGGREESAKEEMSLLAPVLDIEPLRGVPFGELLERFPCPPGVVVAGGLTEEEEREKFHALMVRACKGANLIAASERAELDEWMVNKNPVLVEEMQKEVHSSFQSFKKGLGKSIAKKVIKSNIPIVELSSYTLDFGGYSLSNVCPLARELTQTITITSKTKHKAKLVVNMPTETYGYTFIADVSESILKKKSTLDVTFSLNVAKGSAIVKHVIVIEVEGGARHLLPTHILAEESVFGIPYNEQILGEHAGFTVPVPLILLREAFVAHGGLKTQNVFRASVPETQLQDTKDLLNRKIFEVNSTSNIEIIAALIKVWYREQEPNILNTVPIESFDACDSEAQCLELLESIPEPHKTLLNYLLSLLAEVAREEAVNGMSVRNLSIALAPNLINLDDISPIEALTISQRVVGWVYMCLSSTLHSQVLS